MTKFPGNGTLSSDFSFSNANYLIRRLKEVTKRVLYSACGTFGFDFSNPLLYKLLMARVVILSFG